MENRFENFTYSIFKIAKLTQRIKNLEVADLGLKAVHVMCIYHLNKHSEGLTSKMLVDLTLEDKAAISRALTLLKDKALIDYDGGYNALIILTKEGKEIAKYIECKSKQAIEENGYNIIEEEREQFYQTLKKIETNLQNYYIELNKKV